MWCTDINNSRCSMPIYDERYFLPIHVYDTATSRPVAVLLRPGKTPSGREIVGHLRRLVRRIRRHWPTTKIMLRGDAHYSGFL
jgi:Transposase DDE domain group 1